MKTYLKKSDEELIDIIGNDDDKAFVVLYNRYKSALVSFALLRVPAIEAEDFVQEFFIKLWDQRRIIRIERKFSSYVYSAIRNKIINYYDREVHRKEYLTYLVKYGNQYAERVDHSVREKEFLKELYQLLSAFNPQDMLILKMRMEGYTNPEVAKVLGMAEKTVRNKYSKISKLLQSQIRNLIIIHFL